MISQIRNKTCPPPVSSAVITEMRPRLKTGSWRIRLRDSLPSFPVRDMAAYPCSTMAIIQSGVMFRNELHWITETAGYPARIIALSPTIPLPGNFICNMANGTSSPGLIVSPCWRPHYWPPGTRSAWVTRCCASCPCAVKTSTGPMVRPFKRACASLKIRITRTVEQLAGKRRAPLNGLSWWLFTPRSGTSWKE